MNSDKDGTKNPVIDIAGNKHWYQNYRLHRDDGPAIVYATNRESWYKNGELHRLDGPAVITSSVKRWYINDQRCHNRVQFKLLSGLSDEEILLLVLKYGEIR